MSDKVTDQLAAVIVNYKTFDWTRRAVWSLHGHYPDIKLYVVDNYSQDGSVEALQELEKSIPSLELQINYKNLHHGPAMDQVARLLNTEFFLTFDSDAMLYRPGLLEAMFSEVEPETYAIGHQIYLDERGFKTEKEKGTPYIHPFCALFRTDMYRQLPPFEKHGSPCLTNEKQALKEGRQLKPFPVKAYVYHQWKGTVDKTGHKLGLKSKWDLILHKFGI